MDLESKKGATDFKNDLSLKTIGFLINPIAGMGGAVGLKGTDGETILERALILGAKPIAPAKARDFLSELTPFKRRVRFFVGAGEMGENEARNCGFACTVIGEKKKETSAKDTIEVAKRIVDIGADLLVFCGGDGTARDILNAVNTHLPVLGVPTGVKMHSAVFAVAARAAARITLEFLWEELPLKEAEIMDIDEETFRKGRLSAKLHGYVLSPFEPSLIQGLKIASPKTENEIRNQAALAIYIIQTMKPNIVYVIGPGTTTRTIGDLLDTKKTLLGVDLYYNKKLLANDVNEKQILERIKDKTTKIIVTPIGGQGFIFGRGNQQISSEIIKQVGRDNIIVIATEGKFRNLKSLRVDTGDSRLDEVLRGYIEVRTDYNRERTMQVE